MIAIEWDNKKNDTLKQNRNICFEDVENAILQRQILDIIPHFNQKDYPHQKILIIRLNDYIHYVPFIKDDKKLFLKSIIPSRKYN
jgi:uncharacterized DUF497 family protein